MTEKEIHHIKVGTKNEGRKTGSARASAPCP